MHTRYSRSAFLCFLISLFLCVQTVSYAVAQTNQNPSAESVYHAQKVAASCLNKQWTAPLCLKNLSESALVLSANYAGVLESKGMIGPIEQIKQNCAAASAGTQGDYPAYALTSAFTQCANMIFDVSEQTYIKPDLSHYQILVGSILCLSRDPRCTSIEQQLKAYQ